MSISQQPYKTIASTIATTRSGYLSDRISDVEVNLQAIYDSTVNGAGGSADAPYAGSVPPEFLNHYIFYNTVDGGQTAGKIEATNFGDNLLIPANVDVPALINSVDDEFTLDVTDIFIGKAGTSTIDFQNNTIINSGFSGPVSLTNIGTNSLVSDGTGPALEIKGFEAGTNTTISVTGTNLSINTPTVTLASAGGSTLVTDGTGPALEIKGLAAGDNLSLTANATNIEFDCTIPYTGTDVTNNNYLGFASRTLAVGQKNTAMGDNAMLDANNTQDNVAIGYNCALDISGSNNVLLGSGCATGAAANISTSIIIGKDELAAATFAADCVYIGTQNVTSTIMGASNNVIGKGCAGAINAASNNNIMGQNAAQTLTSGSQNVAIGLNAMSLCGTAVTNNIAIGTAAGQNVSGQYNVNIGYNAGLSLTTGAQNTFVGRIAGAPCIVGSNNCVFGDSVFGEGIDNIMVGSENGAGMTGTCNNNIILAKGFAGGASLSDTIRIGTTQTRNFQVGIRGITTGVADALPVLVDSAHQLGTVSSSELVKENIIPLVDRLNVEKIVRDLKPVSFNYIEAKDPTKKTTMGLIAQQVREILPEICVYTGEEKIEENLTVQYQHIPMLLLAEIQRMQKCIDKLQADVYEMQHKCCVCSDVVKHCCQKK